MRKLTLIGLILLAAIAAMPAGVGLRDAGAQGRDRTPVNLVLSVDNGVEAQLNRMDWDVNAWAPVVPGTGVRASDYIDLLGRTTLTILCSDLTPLEQRGSEVPRCDSYASNPVFFYADDPGWTGADGPAAVAVTDPDPASFPPEIRNPDEIDLRLLEGDDLTRVSERTQTISELGLPPEATAFALSSYYRGQGMLFDAIGALTALPNLGCTERRPAVEPPPADRRPLVQSPVLYLRLGELYEMIGQAGDAERSYLCAAELAEALDDPANAGLAYARQANIAEDTAQAIALYQRAIENYALLGAMDAAQLMLDTCGLRNCAMP